jgi:DNA-binding LytR/AlgR family response regulator
MRRLVRKEARTYLHLTGGHEIPVSRTYLSAVRAALSDADEPRRPI